jgi:imidazolonepropionase-like amidohydrolase
MKDSTRDSRRARGATSRRGFLTGGAGAVAGSALAPLFSGEAKAATQAEDAKTLDRLERANADAGRRILIKGGTVVSMDLKVGNLAHGDVLIEGKKIKDIAPDLSAAARDGKAVILDAKDTVVFPGFVDPHVHAWEGQLGRIIPNSNGVTTDAEHYYFSVAHQIMGP